MNNVICTKWGVKFPADYVNKLYAMVQRNLTLPHRFICFTDNPKGIRDNVEIKPLPSIAATLPLPDRRGWKKLCVFAKDLGDLSGKALYLDIDSVIIDSIDPLLAMDCEFYMLKNKRRREGINGDSNVFVFEIGKHHDILDEFCENTASVMAHFRNDQEYLSHFMLKKGLLRFWPENWCVNFKKKSLPRLPWSFLMHPTIPKGSRIIVFSGKPRIEQAIAGYRSLRRGLNVRPAPWLADYWYE